MPPCRSLSRRNPKREFRPSLGARRSISGTEPYMDAVVGNSFKLASMKHRASGVRLSISASASAGAWKAASVTDCPPERRAVEAAIRSALASGRVAAANPYGDGHASDKIVAVLKSVTEPVQLLQKKFIDLAAA